VFIAIFISPATLMNVFQVHWNAVVPLWFIAVDYIYEGISDWCSNAVYNVQTIEVSSLTSISPNTTFPVHGAYSQPIKNGDNIQNILFYVTYFISCLLLFGNYRVRNYLSISNSLFVAYV
jgi:hypothetical protein